MKTLFLIIVALLFSIGVLSYHYQMNPPEKIHLLYIRDIKECAYKFRHSAREITMDACMKFKGWSK